MSGLRANVGLTDYDSVSWTDWVPTVGRIHLASNMQSLLQWTPPGAAGTNETDVPPTDKHVLLFFTNGVRSLDGRIAGRARRISTDAWNATFLPAGVDSWWASTPATADRIFHLHLARAFLDHVAETALEGDAGRTGALTPIFALNDPVMSGVAQMAFAATGRPQRPPQLVWDAHAWSLALRLLHLFGNALPRSRGGLAPFKLNRVTDHLMARLAEDISLAELATVAGLSPYHFARAFKQSTGMPPHAWLRQKRMERAQELMRTHADMGIAEIAVCVGYENQSAFTTAFKRVTGATPGAWRRGTMD